MVFDRTGIRINLSGAKFDEEDDFDVRLAVGPPKPNQIEEKLTFGSENVANFYYHRKIDISQSSETRVAEVSRRSELSSRGKRTFEARRRRRSSERKSKNDVIYWVTRLSPSSCCAASLN